MAAPFRELNLMDLLRDPLVHLVMASDGVTGTALCRVIETVRRERRDPRPRDEARLPEYMSACCCP
jgi:hypothetical protein